MSGKRRITKPKLSTMKKWGILSFSISIVMNLIAIIGVFCTNKDMTVLGTICGLSDGQLAVFIGAYAYKEKSANKMKMAISFLEKTADKYGVDSISGILTTILQD